ncbi:unnamed protein product [Caenorhabditis bovis]|uniref:RFX-type winged-helix domain-containing protein n=1 Tax=Caenorhabditis bovis TaxID=2654633 RepID=A0A8S1ETE9_9PELO|nr:unnamed protein product [Caenorhabditis bovis]
MYLPQCNSMYSSVTPATYTVYAPEPNGYGYYQYQSNMQPSPQDTNYMVVQQQQQQQQQQGATSPGSVDDNDSNSLGHTTRASPATIQWLLDNYETADGTSLPRCTLYDHYKRHCVEHRLDPVNAASFGKLIRSVFLGLRTRRLGTRGNSKYHYYGIRIKPDSPLMHATAAAANAAGMSNNHIAYCQDGYSETVNTVASIKYDECPPMHAVKRMKTESSSSSSCRDSVSPIMKHTAVLARPAPPTSQPLEPSHRQVTDEDRNSIADLPLVSLSFQTSASLEANLRKLMLTTEHLEKFINSYNFMCKEILSLVKKLEFDGVQDCWMRFWHGNDSTFTITREELLALCTVEQVQDYIIEVDLNLYQTIVDCLIPNVLMSQLSTSLTQTCRYFAKNIDINLGRCLQHSGIPEKLQKKKLQAVRYMQVGMKRYTSLNHLAQAARSVLQKQDQVVQMYNDFKNVDMQQVQEQAGWICGCDKTMVEHMHAAFKTNLERMTPMTEWAEWLESIVDQVLAKYHDKPAKDIAEVGKQFLLNWSFYTSMIIKDLTLRSATSFGSFHLIRLLADDYMFYLIESKIAKAGNQQVITVIHQQCKSATHEYIIPTNSSQRSLDSFSLDEVNSEVPSL